MPAPRTRQTAELEPRSHPPLRSRSHPLRRPRQNRCPRSVVDTEVRGDRGGRRVIVRAVKTANAAFNTRPATDRPRSGNREASTATHKTCRSLTGLQSPPMRPTVPHQCQQPRPRNADVADNLARASDASADRTDQLPAPAGCHPRTPHASRASADLTDQSPAPARTSFAAPARTSFAAPARTSFAAPARTSFAAPARTSLTNSPRQTRQPRQRGPQ
jgi:hypothetical protein